MIFMVLAAGALVGVVTKLAAPVRKLRAATDMMAGLKRGEMKQPMRLELLLSLEQFDRLMGDREVELAFIEMSALRRTGAVPVCHECGGACV